MFAAALKHSPNVCNCRCASLLCLPDKIQDAQADLSSGKQQSFVVVVVSVGVEFQF